MSRWTDSLSKSHQLRGKGTKHTAAEPQAATTTGGQGYRSKLEQRMHATLLWMEKGGLIRNIRREQTIQLTPSISHRIDYVVFDIKRNTDIGVEPKGREMETWLMKKRLYRDFTSMPIQIWVDAGRERIMMKEEIPVGKYKIVLAGEK